jgi:hypothetical protein
MFFLAFSNIYFYLLKESSSVFQKLFPIFSIDEKILKISFVIFSSWINVNKSIFLLNSLYSFKIDDFLID